MNHLVFSIFDSKAEAHLPPFILPRQEMAQRIFSDAVNSKDHQFGKNPADYTLFRLGTFDDETAIFVAEKTPQTLGLGVEYVQTMDVMATEGLSNAEANRTHEPQVGNGSSVQPGPTGPDSEV